MLKESNSGNGFCSSEKEPYFKVTLKDVYCKGEDYQKENREFQATVTSRLLSLETAIKENNEIKEDIEKINDRCRVSLYDDNGIYKRLEKRLFDIEDSHGVEIGTKMGKDSVEKAILRWIPAILGLISLGITLYLIISNTKLGS